MAGAAGLGRTIPALPARDVAASTAHYVAKFGFEVLHEDAGFSVLRRDEAVLHLWESGDDAWRGRAGFAETPIRSGAESFLAGTGSCRIEVVDVDVLFTELAAAGVLHPSFQNGVRATDFGTREFPTVDLDGNLIEFYRWET